MPCKCYISFYYKDATYMRAIKRMFRKSRDVEIMYCKTAKGDSYQQTVNLISEANCVIAIISQKAINRSDEIF